MKKAELLINGIDDSLQKPVGPRYIVAIETKRKKTRNKKYGFEKKVGRVGKWFEGLKKLKWLEGLGKSWIIDLRD